MRTRIAQPARGSLIALLAALALVVAACAGDEAEPEPTQPPATTQPPAATQPPATQPPAAEKPSVVVALSDTPNLIEPHTFRTTSAYWVTDALYDPLIWQQFEQDAEGVWIGQTVHEGRGAVSFQASADGLEYTFTIRDDAKFATGEPVLAEDYMYVFQRSIESPEDQGEGYIPLLLQFLGIDSADQLGVVDDHTFVIRPTISSPLFEREMTFQVFGALDKDFLESVATEEDPWSFRALDQAGAGSGPYQLAEWNPETQVVLDPNPNWWNAENISNGGVIIRNVPNADERALLLQSGDLDLASGLPPAVLSDLAADPNITVISRPTSGVEYLGMNNGIAPLDNADFRKAIAYAIDYQALLDQVMFGYASYAGTVVPTHMETHAGLGPTLDLETAQGHLDASGVDTSDVVLTLGVRESRSTNQEAAVIIQDNLRQIGINVEIDILPDADFAAKQNANELPLQIHDWYSWGEDPFYQMSFLTTCGQFTNYARYCNEAYDALVAEGVQTADLGTRQDLSTSAQEIFLEDMPWATLWSTDRTFAVQSCMTGVEMNYTGAASFWRMDTSNC